MGASSVGMTGKCAVERCKEDWVEERRIRVNTLRYGGEVTVRVMLCRAHEEELDAA